MCSLNCILLISYYIIIVLEHIFIIIIILKSLFYNNFISRPSIKNNWAGSFNTHIDWLSVCTLLDNKIKKTATDYYSVCFSLSLNACSVVTDFHPFALFFCFLHPQCNAASACWFMLMNLPVPRCHPIGQIPSWLSHRILIKLPTTPENSLKRPRDPSEDYVLVHVFALHFFKFKKKIARILESGLNLVLD